MTMTPLAYRPTNNQEGWIIVGVQVRQSTRKPMLKRGEGKSISSLIAKRKASSPEAATSLANARKKLAGTLEENQGQSLKAYRLRKGLSQKELADLMDTQQSYIARIEKNATELRSKTILKLARALDITCDEVIEAVESNE